MYVNGEKTQEGKELQYGNGDIVPAVHESACVEELKVH